MNRRDLIRNVVMSGATLIIVPPLFTSCSKEDDPGGNNGNPNPDKITLDLAGSSYSPLAVAGASVVVQGKIIANTGGDIFIALDSICTHEGCTIGYNLAANNFPCPCHGSVYSTSGLVVNGPATVGLKSYPVTKAGSILTVTLR